MQYSQDPSNTVYGLELLLLGWLAHVECAGALLYQLSRICPCAIVFPCSLFVVAMLPYCCTLFCPS